MKYSVGDVARLMGLTPGALHYYEREGILFSQRDKQGRRYYDDAAIWRLLSYEKYHAMAYPLKLVLDQFTNGVSYQVIRARVQDRLREAREKAEYYRKLATAIEAHVAGHERIDELLNQYAFERSVPFYFWHAENGWISKKKREQEEAARWIAAMPAMQLALLWNAEEAAALDAHSKGVFGYSITPQMAELFDFAIPPDATFVPAQSCLRTVVTCANDFADVPQSVFLQALDYAKAHMFQLAGAPMAHVLLVEAFSDGALRAYVDVWIPIK